MRSGYASTRSSMTTPKTSADYGFVGKKQGGLLDTRPVTTKINHRRTQTVFSEETLKNKFDEHANTQQEQFISAGFPPKICSELVDQLCGDARKLSCTVLDVGCGNGYVGQYLKELGFFKIQGIDCRRTKLLCAEQKQVYENVQRGVFGIKGSVVPENFLNAFDFVTCASLINNCDLTIKIFEDLISCVKIGGFIIFATKLDQKNFNEYEKEINQLTENGYWKFTTDHTFYRYDKLFGDLGKFSNK